MRRASSETAIRADSFSKPGRSNGYAADIARERGLDVWNVATIGPVAAHIASIDSDGLDGSCTWSTSKSFSASQRLTRDEATGPKLMRAIEPL